MSALTAPTSSTWIQRGRNPHRDGMLPSIVDIRHHPTGAIVDNVEALCRSVVTRCANGRDLEDCDYVEALGFLLGRVVEVVDRYAPANDRSRIGAWLKQELLWDLQDHWERLNGRNGEKRVYDSRRVEQARRDGGVDDGDPGVHRPDHLAGQGAADVEGDRAFPREWSDVVGDRGGTRPAEGLGVEPGGGGAGGADRRGAGAGRRDGRGVAGQDRGAPAWLDCVSCEWRHYPFAPNGFPGWHYPDACLSCGAALR